VLSYYKQAETILKEKIQKDQELISYRYSSCSSCYCCCCRGYCLQKRPMVSSFQNG